MSTSLVCIACGARYDARTVIYRCATCGDLLDVRHEPLPDGDVLTRPAVIPLAGGAEERSGVWRYRPWITGDLDAPPAARPEGNTTLYGSDALAAWANVDTLWLKHEGENPTGSFKDRGMTVGVTVARALGAATVACASTGNTSASMAAYAAVAGLKALVFIPEGKIAYGKLSQSIAYGARTVQVRGDFDAAMALVSEAADELRLYILNSINPWRLEGQKSIIFELLQQLAWRQPDWIVVPGGNLGNTSAFGKALHELHEMGVLARLPRLAVIQAEGANPFARAFAADFRSCPPMRAETLATAIRIGQPVNYPKAVRAVRWTNGVVSDVSDQQIMDAKARIDAAGVGCEPASAASLAGARDLRRRGVIAAGDSVVCILTGHVLKDPDATMKYHLDQLDGFAGDQRNAPIQVDPTIVALRRVLGDSLVRA